MPKKQKTPEERRARLDRKKQLSPKRAAETDEERSKR